MDSPRRIRSEEQQHIRQRLWRDPLAEISIRHGLAIDRGINDAGKHAVDVDSIGLYLSGHGLSQADDGALGGAVGRRFRAALQGLAALRC
jgi:hypothetical protein